MIYMMVPDPTGVVNSNVRTVSFVAGITPITLGAEFQRLINASRRTYITNASSLETSWLETGLSDIAGELIFYQNSIGLTPQSNIVLTNLTTGPNASRRVAAFNTFANQNFGRFRDSLQRPDIRSPFAASSSADELGRRGALWNFLRYIADRKGGNQNTFWASLVDSNLTGNANLQNAIGAGNDLTTWLRDWTMAVYADDAVVGASADFSHQSWNYRSLYIALNGSYQLSLRLLSDNTSLTLNYVAGGGSSHARFAVSTNSTATLLLRSNSNPPNTTVNMTLMRVR
jgi:hypothetical protein